MRISISEITTKIVWRDQLLVDPRQEEELENIMELIFFYLDKKPIAYNKAIIQSLLTD